MSDIFEQLTNDASYDDARRAEKWNEWTALVFVRIEQFERTYGKYVPTPSGARRSGYIPPIRRALCLLQGAVLPGQSIHFTGEWGNHETATGNGRMSAQFPVQMSRMAEGDAGLG